MKKPLSKTEETMLKLLLTEGELWHRQFLKYDIGDKPLRRYLRKLETKGYIMRRKPPNWKRGMRIPYLLSPKGERVAARLAMDDRARRLFVQVLEELKSMAELPDDKGERVAEHALRIVNMLDDREKSRRLRDIVVRFIEKMG